MPADGASLQVCAAARDDHRAARDDGPLGEVPAGVRTRTGAAAGSPSAASRCSDYFGGTFAQDASGLNAAIERAMRALAGPRSFS